VNDHDSRYARLRYTATGALAALAAVGAIAGSVALATNRRHHPHRDAAAANSGTTTNGSNGAVTKTPTSPAPAKSRTGQPPVNQQPFLNAIEQLVDSGTLTAAEGQTVDSEIQAGRIDTDTLAAGGFTQTQIEAVQQALSSAKMALAPQSPPSGPKNPTPQPKP
jgi:hypothetical protein